MKRILTASAVAIMVAGLTPAAEAQVDLGLDASGGTTLKSRGTESTTGTDLRIDGGAQLDTGPADAQVDIETESSGAAGTEGSSQETPPAATGEPQDNASPGLVNLAEGSAILGATVRDRAGDRVGTVRDIVQRPDGSQLIVVKVGGFLGFFGKDVAFAPDQLTASADGSLRTQLTEADIDTMPEFDGDESS